MTSDSKSEMLRGWEVNSVEKCQETCSAMASCKFAISRKGKGFGVTYGTQRSVLRMRMVRI